MARFSKKNEKVIVPKMCVFDFACYFFLKRFSFQEKLSENLP